MEINEEAYDRYLVEMSLRRSYVKRRIVEYLSLHEFSYISEIARNIGSPATNVCGAIRGMDGRYNPEESLLKLGIISEIFTKRKCRTKLYCLSSHVGQDSVKICKRFNKELSGVML